MVQEHLGDPACQKRQGLLERGRSTPLAHPSLLEIPFHLVSLWILEVQPLLAAHRGPEAQRGRLPEVPQVRWRLSAREVPGHPSLQRALVVPAVREAPERQANLALQALPGAPGLLCLAAPALPVCPSVLGALELHADQAGPVSQAGPRLRDPALLWGRASQAAPSCPSAPPAGWGRRCSLHPFLLSAPWGPDPQALLTVLAVPRHPASQGLRDCQLHPSAPSDHALQLRPVFLVGRSQGAQAPLSLQVGQARPPRGCPHPEAWTGLSRAHKAPPSPP